MKPNYIFTAGTVEGYKFLAPLASLLDDEAEAELFHIESSTPSRKEFDGAYTLISEIRGRRVGIIYNDFKISGGSYGIENSKRIVAFLDYLTKNNLPLVFSINSIGVRFMEGRKVFKYAFQIMPALEKYIQNNLFITCSIGQTLGLGALLFDLGDYRLALKKKSLLNLTGPNVYELFFGKGIDFDKVSSADNQLNITNMVSDHFHDKDIMYEHVRDIFAIEQNQKFEAKKTSRKAPKHTITSSKLREAHALEELLNRDTT